MVKQQKGFSLVELMITGVVGLIVFGGLINLLIATDEVTDDTVQNGELQEVGIYALNVLSQDLMMHGYFGDQSGEAFFVDEDINGAVNLNGSAVSTDCTDEINGTFPHSSGILFKTLWLKKAEGTDDFGCIPDAKKNSTILQIKRGLTSEINSGEESNTRYYFTTVDGQKNFYAGNNHASFTPSTDQVSTAQYMEYQNHIYYVREQTQGEIKVPVLARYQLEKEAGAAASAGNLVSYDLVEGVEYVSVLAGLDLTGDNGSGDGIADVYVSADYIQENYKLGVSMVSDEIPIVSAKIYVLVRSLSPDARVENKMSYDLGDWVFSPGGDGYRRMLFTTTVNMPNTGDRSWKLN